MRVRGDGHAAIGRNRGIVRNRLDIGLAGASNFVPNYARGPSHGACQGLTPGRRAITGGASDFLAPREMVREWSRSRSRSSRMKVVSKPSAMKRIAVDQEPSSPSTYSSPTAASARLGDLVDEIATGHAAAHPEGELGTGRQTLEDGREPPKITIMA
jgi:hypothetical protein